MRALHLLTARILSGFDESAAGWMAGRDEVEEALARIERNVERLLLDPAHPDLERPAARPLLDHRLCALLRSELLRPDDGAAGPGGRDGGLPDEDLPPRDAEEVLGTLQALERYRSILQPADQEALATRLAAPDAFELVVELAHDLRSPLNSILFLSEVLRSGRSGPVTEHQWKQLGLIYSASLGMVSVVSDVVELASDERGTPPDEPEPFSIGSVFDSVRKLLDPMAEEKGVELAFELPDYDRCVGRPAPLGRILLNLTTNALKFTDEGWVRVSARKVGRSIVEFSVEDSGRGMDERELEKLFQPFRKSANREGYFFSGSGLGLSIARRMLATLGSELDVASQPGEGSRFSFRVELPQI